MLKPLCAVPFGAALILFALLTQPWAAETGIASIYTSRESRGFMACFIEGKARKLDDGALTAAHKTRPCGTRLKVTNLNNRNTVLVTVTDRGPHIKGRIIDLTKAGQAALAMGGLAPVKIEVVAE